MTAAHELEWADWWDDEDPAGPVTGGGTPDDGIAVELFLNEQWVDITRISKEQPGVYYRDAITITRGQRDESQQSQANPASCMFTVNNQDGRFSPRNATGPYYGYLTRNTPVRVAKVVDGTRRYRFYGEVSSWPVRSDISGTDVYVPVEAYGVFRRLGQGAAPLDSAYYRAVIRKASSLVDYWPFEDAAGSTSIASATGGHPMNWNGTPTLASDNNFVCSSPLAVMDATTEFHAGTTPYTAGNYTQIRFLFTYPAGAAMNQVLVRASTTGTASTWDVYAATGGGLRISAFDQADTNVLFTGPLTETDGALLLVSLELTQNGANVDYALQTVTVGNSTSSSITGTLNSYTVGRVKQLLVSPGGGTNTAVVGHLTLQNAITPVTEFATQLAAGAGEAAGRRAERLCAEEGIEFHSVGDLDDTAQMGAQNPSTLLTLLAECETADNGMLYEPRDALAVGYRTRTSMYNQSAALDLDCAQHEIADSLSPVEDDQATRNDVTATRTNGSWARVELGSGALSVLPPPDGVGRYADSVTVNVAADTSLRDQAGWRVHLGTVDEDRHPTVPVNLKHPAFAGSQTLRNGALVVDVGDRLTISNPPSWLPPDTISQLVRGYSEFFTGDQHMITYTCSPESPYQVAVIEDTVLGHLDTEGSQLTVDISAAAASVSVTTTSGPVWTTAAGDFPFDVTVGGEVWTVTAITGATSPQTFTVTRSINGVVKPHKAGTALSLTHPMILAL